MKCLSCDRILNDYESTRKYPDGEFIDLCSSCFNNSDLANMPVIVRDDLDNGYEVDSDDGELD